MRRTDHREARRRRFEPQFARLGARVRQRGERSSTINAP